MMARGLTERATAGDAAIRGYVMQLLATALHEDQEFESYMVREKRDTGPG